jgi:hypothetical protein
MVPPPQLLLRLRQPPLLPPTTALSLQADSRCSSCDAPLAFGVNQCLANPIRYGSASMSFNCPR